MINLRVISSLSSYISDSSVRFDKEPVFTFDTGSLFNLKRIRLARESLFTDWSYFLLLLLKVELNYYAFFVGN